VKRILAAVTAALLVIALVPGVSAGGSATGASGVTAGGSATGLADARVCWMGGYRQSADIIGAFTGTVGPFASQYACLSYGAHGGVLYVPIGIVLPENWAAAHQGRLSDALEAAGYNAQILFSQDSATEKAAVETLIRRGVKVLILAPQDGAAAAAAAREARAAGVKVIAYDRLILNTRSVDYYATFDLTGVGAAQAQYLITTAGTTKGNSLYLYAGNPVDNNSFLFFEGAWEKLQPRIADGTFVIRNSSVALGLQDHPTLTHEQEAAVFDQITTDWNYGVAFALAKDDLKAAPPANGTAFILAPNDETARAIADAIKPPSQLATTSYLTGQDTDQIWVQRLIDGTHGMTVFKDPRTLARNTVAASVAFLKCRRPVVTTTFNNGVFDVPSRAAAPVPVTIDNIQSALIDTGYYQASDFTGSWPGKP
jgi:putative multiple sugar transport system substrate-binding protein